MSLKTVSPNRLPNQSPKCAFDSDTPHGATRLSSAEGKTTAAECARFPKSLLSSGIAFGFAAILLALAANSYSAAVVSTSSGIGASFVQPAPEIAVVFRFAVVDVADTTPGQDLWEYSYDVSGLALTTGQGFTIFFDFNLYALLQNPPPLVNADWDAITVQPDIALSSRGFYDAQALRNTPSLADPFKVRFVWLGTGAPGAQPVTVYNADFSTQSQGQTTNVPEPPMFLLLLTGVCGLARRRK